VWRAFLASLHVLAPALCRRRTSASYRYDVRVGTVLPEAGISYYEVPLGPLAAAFYIQKWFRLLFDRRNSNVGELDPVPHATPPRHNDGRCRNRFGLSRHGGLSGAVEIMQSDFEGDVHDIVEFASGPRVHGKVRYFLRR
jgi:hypothetical protein